MAVEILSPPRKPSWFKIRPPGGPRYEFVKGRVRSLRLNTVCEEARCPNLSECWGGGTATFMLMGDTCTRGCRFCHVQSGRPNAPPDPGEPGRLVEAVREMGLDYVVVTSVNRDDLPGGGAAHFAGAVRALRTALPGLVVEVLTPDFQGDADALRLLASSGAHVLGHNLETVRRLTPGVRDRRAAYDLSLEVLRAYRRLDPAALTKSSLMLGLGETEEEVVESLRDLRAAGTSLLALGQYLRPSAFHLPVAEYVAPEKFDRLAAIGRDLGFGCVAAGPLVRSSYRAGEFYVHHALKGRPPAADRPLDPLAP